MILDLFRPCRSAVTTNVIRQIRQTIKEIIHIRWVVDVNTTQELHAGTQQRPEAKTEMTAIAFKKTSQNAKEVN